MFKQIGVAIWVLIGFIALLNPNGVIAQDEVAVDTDLVVFMFGRDDCGFCQAQKEFFTEANISYEYLNIVTDDTAKALYDQVVAKHAVTKVTPITIVGEQIFVGFNGPQTTGFAIQNAIAAIEQSGVRSLEDHIANAPVSSVDMAGGCGEFGCTAGETNSYLFDLPIIGLVDLKAFSLFTLSLTLGTIDGFNPCAMWVLITFLVLLTQAGSRKKMIILAGAFILAEGIMYNLILNVWYSIWDFVALDQIVTPLVGLLALGGGIFFLFRWQKNRKVALVCDISDIESQNKTINKFQALISQPLTIFTFGAIILIAFSVNIIEFACSLGIPQAYTKILDLNMLTFMERQWYILVYTLGYMIDDVIVFALAIWGFSKLEAHGHRYAQLSLLIGGTLMLLLGLLLIFNPNLLVI